MIWRTMWISVLVANCGGVAAQEFVPAVPPPGSPPEAFAAADIAPPIRLPAVELLAPRTERLTQATWYARIDYFHWKERFDGQDFVTEDGPLTTVGYLRRVGPERFRAELFGGQIGYLGGVQYDDGTSEPLQSHTNYLGLRGEYDLLYEPDWWPTATLLAGLGTRFWFRDLPDDTTASGNLVWGYQETWWTIYPYLGIETRDQTDGGEIEFFAATRIGSTAITYQHVSLADVTLYPKLGLTSQAEVGLRGPHVFLSTYFELMTWRESALVRDSLQPRSRLMTVGLRTGLRF